MKLTRCKLIALNFSQPQGTPTDGIIQSVQHGRYLHVDLDDSTLMGYKVFGVVVDKETVDELGYTTQGDVRAYVQFQQAVPKGMHRLPGWPADLFDSMAPPPAPAPMVALGPRERLRDDLCELSPLSEGPAVPPGVRAASPWRHARGYYLLLSDAETGKELGGWRRAMGWPRSWSTTARRMSSPRAGRTAGTMSPSSARRT